MEDKDIVDLMCEYDLYYDTFNDDPNDPFCRKPPENRHGSNGHSDLSGIWKAVVYALLGIIIAFFLSFLKK